MTALSKIKESLLGYWNAFLHHVPNLILGLIILISAFLIAGWLSQVFQRRFGRRIGDPLLSAFLSRILKTVLIILGILLAFHVMGLTGIAAGLMAGAGVGALVIGFAFQDVGANFVAGVILAFNRPFGVGDTIEIEGVMGTVLSLNLRTTQIKTFDGKDIYIPNNTIVKEELINYTKDGLIRLDFMVGIDYEDDVEKAIKVILGSTQKIEGVLQTIDHKPMVVIHDLGVSTINLKVNFWLETFDYRRGTIETRSLVIAQALKDLIASGIGLPADIVELKYYKGENFPIKVINPSLPHQKKNPTTGNKAVE